MLSMWWKQYALETCSRLWHAALATGQYTVQDSGVPRARLLNSFLQKKQCLLIINSDKQRAWNMLLKRDTRILDNI